MHEMQVVLDAPMASAMKEDAATHRYEDEHGAEDLYLTLANEAHRVHSFKLLQSLIRRANTVEARYLAMSLANMQARLNAQRFATAYSLEAIKLAAERVLNECERRNAES